MTGLTFTVAADEAGRIDKLLARRYPGTSRALLARFFADRKVRIDGAVARKGDIAAPGARVALDEAPPTPSSLAPAPDPGAPLSVLYEDEWLVALDKPPGTPSHPLHPGERGTLTNALIARYPECATVGDDPREAGLVHRLDADTTGVIVAARDPRTWRAARDTFGSGRVRKEYLALVVGEATDGEADAPVAGQPAHTEWTVERALPGFALLRCRARTGRRHQIRAHLAGAGHPIVGDHRYGYEGDVPGHVLHAARLILPHPRTGDELALEAPLPPARAALVEALAAGTEASSR